MISQIVCFQFLTNSDQTSILLWSALQSKQKFFSAYSLPAYITDFLLNCAAILFATTTYSSAPLLLNGLLVLPAVVLIITSRPKKVKTKRKIPNDGVSAASSNPLPVKPFVTSYRGSMMVITCIAILAVDFHIFPRRFAKVEDWGTSLMDMGVGSFVFSSGLVSARGVLKDRISKSITPLPRRFLSSFRHSLPLLILGLIRLYSVKGLDYAEHVTEYGVHWNFFFTLGLLPPFVAVFQTLFTLIPSYSILSMTLALAYEVILQNTELTTYIISAPRVDLLSQNREGVFSFIGYFAIFLAGLGTGTYVLPREHPLPANSAWSAYARRTIFGKLGAWAFVWSSLYMITTSYYLFNLSVSRRLANMPYVLWVCAYNCAQLTACRAIEAVLFPDILSASDSHTETRRCNESASLILRAFNRNGLPLFLLANLLTGLVNLTLPTLDMDKFQSLAVLLAYIGILSSAAVFLETRDITIKF